MKRKILIIITLFLFQSLVRANVKPNGLFSNNAVIQQGVAVPVWGVADIDEKITIEFAGQKISVTTTKDGKWNAKLKPLKAGGPYEMIIKGKNTIILSNIMVGEVWLCSGQSNMVYQVERIAPEGNSQKLADVLIEAANYPEIRQFSIPLSNYTSIPETAIDINGGWDICNSQSVKKFSAVGYFFAKDLYKKLNVPIGIINSSYGGTMIEQWIAKDYLMQSPELEKTLKDYERNLNQFPSRLEKFQLDEPKLLEKWRSDSELAKSEGKELPRKPMPPRHPASSGGPTGLYNAMIAPLAPFAIKGVAWYQGEQNASRGMQYRQLLPTLIKNWRTTWSNQNLPFIIVQLPAHRNLKPELREAQLLTTKVVPNTALVVTTDCHTDTTDIHPRNKQPVGERLAVAARGLAYNEKIEFQGPIYESHKVERNKIVLSFKHVGKGLTTNGKDLKDFFIAGPDKKFYPANAVIKDNNVVVYNDNVKIPVAVRMGWNTTPIINLYNKEGLLAPPFRTDVE